MYNFLSIILLEITYKKPIENSIKTDNYFRFKFIICPLHVLSKKHFKFTTFKKIIHLIG